MSDSTFSFTAPFPSSSSPAPLHAALKQRRVSLALPSSPRLVPAWDFRDDTGIQSHVPETTSTLVSEKRGKMRKIASTVDRDDPDAACEKKQRKKWSMEETQMLVDGCNVYGVGNWKAILSDPNLKFDNRSPVDLKDRFRTYFPDAYKQHYPNAKTHLSSKVRSTLPDGTSIFEKTRSKKRRPFTEEEDRALKAGYEKHGTVWAAIVKDPIFQEQNRRSTDLRDRFRNAYPELYQAAGYKPRGAPKKKNIDASLPVRAATDDQLAMSTVNGPKRRRRAHTSQGLFRGGTKSVPQSATCSEDEDSSGGEDETEQLYKKPSIFKDNTPQPDTSHTSSDTSADMDLQAIDPLPDSLSIPDFMHSSSQSEITDSQSQAWSSGIDTPLNSHTWSTAAGSPTSSHLSSDYLVNQSPFHRRSDAFNTIGKSAWGPQDWFSANPRLDPTSGSHSLFDAVSPSPSSPFSFHHLNHGVLDRYDLFPTSFAHDYTSEVGVGDTHSTFSDEIFPNGFRGFTHHSNYAGDLIFGARSHHTQPGYYGSGGSFNFGTPGLGLSGMQQPVGIHPSQLHTPALPGIDEIELTGISLNDDIPLEPLNGPVDVSVGMPKEDAIQEHAAFGLEELVTLSHELHDTPPCTPLTQSQPLRTSSLDFHPMPSHGRSISVPPSEARSTMARSVSNHESSIQVSPLQPQPEPITATPSLPLFHSLSQANINPQHLTTHSNSHPVLSFPSMSTSTSSGPYHPDEMRTAQHAELYNLPFLDLHYYSSLHGNALGGGLGMGGAFDPESQHQRQDQALDLAQPVRVVMSSKSHAPIGVPMAAAAQQPRSRFAAPSAAGSLPPPPPPVRSQSLHHRGQSAISPQDLLFRKGSDNKRKRASWDGGAS